MESAPLYTPRPPSDRPPFRCGSRTDLTTVRLCAGRRKATPRRSSHMRDLSRPPAAPAASAARPSWAKYDLPTRVHRPHSCNQKVDRSRGLSGYTVESTSGLPRPLRACGDIGEDPCESDAPRRDAGARERASHGRACRPHGWWSLLAHAARSSGRSMCAPDSSLCESRSRCQLASDRNVVPASDPGCHSGRIT